MSRDDAVGSPVTDENAPSALPEDHVPTPEETLDQLLDDEVVEAELLEPSPAALEALLDLPEDPDEARTMLVEQLLATRQEAGEYLETMQRIAAEYDNYRKRAERDESEIVMRASQRVVHALLPSLDSFDGALAYEAQTPTEEKLLDGMRGTHQLLLETLAREGFEPIPAIGETFDPAVHEAAAGPAGTEGDLVVTQELRRGYTLRGRVVRPTLVIVEPADEHGRAE